MPAYNVERTLELTLSSIPKNLIDEVLVVNDGSRDQTRGIAERLGFTVLTHDKNRGYGGAQKTGYLEALRRGADVVVMLHADFQYDPLRLPALLTPIVNGEADACFGSRLHTKRSALDGGMPWWRFAANIGLTLVLETVYHLHLTEYHTGYRAYSRHTLESIPFASDSNNYVFDSEMIAQLAAGHFRVAEVPIPTRYTKDSQSPTLKQSVVYGFSTLGVAGKYILHRLHIWRSPMFSIASR